MTTKTPEQIAIAVTLENYGRESDPEVWEASRDVDNPSAHVPVRHLLDAALTAGHLDGDGIMSMLRAAVEADRAQHETGRICKHCETPVIRAAHPTTGEPDWKHDEGDGNGTWACYTYGGLDTFAEVECVCS
jgi:hypothetical protein